MIQVLAVLMMMVGAIGLIVGMLKMAKEFYE